MKKAILLATLLLGNLYADEMNQIDPEFANMAKEYESYSKQTHQEFEDYSLALENEFKAYKKELEAFWEDPKLSSKKEWISYSKDKKTRSVVDFENNTLSVQTVATSEEEAKQQLAKQLAFSVSADTKEVVDKDPLQNRIAKLSKISDTPQAKIDDKSILGSVLFENKPSQRELKEFTENHLGIISHADSKHGIVYTVNVPLPKDTTLKRSKVYEDEVIANAKRFELPVALVFAIMHTESNFNPFAKSHVPAYGLMQIVPRSAGMDAYNFLYNEKRKPSSSYLYNSQNNIELGGAYLHMLYYKYLKDIKDPMSRLYCTIAAYNTGAGNIAWAFTHRYNIHEAAHKINDLSAAQVYDKLFEDLRYDEARYYLKNVHKRMDIFHRVYHDI